MEQREGRNRHMEQQVASCPSRDTLVIGGDHNAHIGGGSQRDQVCGKFGIRGTGEEGEDLLSWCVDHNLAYDNSFSNHRRRGTWYHNALKRWYELDGFILKQAQRHKILRKVSSIN